MSQPANPAMRDGSQDAEKGTQQVPGGAVKGSTKELSVGLASSVTPPATATGILKGLSAWDVGNLGGLTCSTGGGGNGRQGSGQSLDRDVRDVSWGYFTRTGNSSTENGGRGSRRGRDQGKVVDHESRRSVLVMRGKMGSSRAEATDGRPSGGRAGGVVPCGHRRPSLVGFLGSSHCDREITGSAPSNVGFLSLS